MSVLLTAISTPTPHDAPRPATVIPEKGVEHKEWNKEEKKEKFFLFSTVVN